MSKNKDSLHFPTVAFSDRSSFAWMQTLRTLGFALLWGALTFLLGFFLYGVELSLVLIVVLFFICPVILPILFWQTLVWKYDLKPLDLRLNQNADLAQSYFESMLTLPGPRPIFYYYRGSEALMFWFERSVSRRSEQIVIVSDLWLQETSKNRCQDFVSLWKMILVQNRMERRVRTMQIVLWMSLMAPFEILSRIFHKVFVILGCVDLPHLSFWTFRTLKSFQNFWFGIKDQSDPLSGVLNYQRYYEPKIWRSWSFGVWIQIPRRNLHPLVKALTQRDMLLE